MFPLITLPEVWEFSGTLTWSNKHIYIPTETHTHTRTHIHTCDKNSGDERNYVEKEEAVDIDDDGCGDNIRNIMVIVVITMKVIVIVMIT